MFHLLNKNMLSGSTNNNYYYCCCPGAPGRDQQAPAADPRPGPPVRQCVRIRVSGHGRETAEPAGRRPGRAGRVETGGHRQAERAAGGDEGGGAAPARDGRLRGGRGQAAAVDHRHQACHTQSAQLRGQRQAARTAEAAAGGWGHWGFITYPEVSVKLPEQQRLQQVGVVTGICTEDHMSGVLFIFYFTINFK